MQQVCFSDGRRNVRASDSFRGEHTLFDKRAIFHNSSHRRDACLAPSVRSCSINTCWSIDWFRILAGGLSTAKAGLCWGCGSEVGSDVSRNSPGFKTGPQAGPQLPLTLANSGTISCLCFYFSCEESCLIDLMNSLPSLAWGGDIIHALMPPVFCKLQDYYGWNDKKHCFHQIRAKAMNCPSFKWRVPICPGGNVRPDLRAANIKLEFPPSWDISMHSKATIPFTWMFLFLSFWRHIIDSLIRELFFFFSSNYIWRFFSLCWLKISLKRT